MADSYTVLPCKFLVICGDGAIGCEFTQWDCSYFGRIEECPLYIASESFSF